MMPEPACPLCGGEVHYDFEPPICEDCGAEFEVKGDLIIPTTAPIDGFKLLTGKIAGLWGSLTLDERIEIVSDVWSLWMEADSCARAHPEVGETKEGG